jgi:hypothetical protein
MSLIKIGDSFHAKARPQPIYVAEREHEFNGKRYICGSYQHAYNQRVGIDLPEEELTKIESNPVQQPELNLQTRTAVISDKLSAARAIADRIHVLRHRRINEACRLAGLGSMGCQLHNSLVSLHYGQPWREVDYHYARKADWLVRTSYEPSRIIDRFYARLIAEWRASGCQ